MSHRETEPENVAKVSYSILKPDSHGIFLDSNI